MAAELDAKKAEIEKLLEEFEWHGRRVTEISREVGRLLNSLVDQHGVEGLKVTSELYQRLSQIAAKSVAATHERLRSGGSSSDVV